MKISEVTSFLFGEHILISFSKDWINMFKSLPRFTAEFKEGKLVLTSQIFSEDKA